MPVLEAFFYIFLDLFVSMSVLRRFVLDAEHIVFLFVFYIAALLECFGSPRNLHQTRHTNLWKIDEKHTKNENICFS